MKGRLPEFIGIGFRRGGSSWLHSCLNEHPDIGKPRRGVHFFSEHLHKGVEWYIEKLEEHSKRPILLEFSISYSYPEYYEKAAKYMHQIVPNAKLFMVVRNPIERAFSDYRRSIYLLQIKKNISFEEAIDRHPVFLKRGLYGQIIEHYMEFFPKEQILVLFYDDLLINPRAFIQYLFKFLDAKPNLELTWIKKRIPSPNIIKWELYNRIIFTLKDTGGILAPKLGIENLWTAFRIKLGGVYWKILSLNKSKMEIPLIIRKSLRNYFERDIRKLENLTGRNLDNWK